MMWVWLIYSCVIIRHQWTCNKTIFVFRLVGGDLITYALELSLYSNFLQHAYGFFTCLLIFIYYTSHCLPYAATGLLSLFLSSFFLLETAKMNAQWLITLSYMNEWNIWMNEWNKWNEWNIWMKYFYFMLLLLIQLVSRLKENSCTKSKMYDQG